MESDFSHYKAVISGALYFVIIIIALIREMSGKNHCNNKIVRLMRCHIKVFNISAKQVLMYYSAYLSIIHGYRMIRYIYKLISLLQIISIDSLLKISW